MTNFGENRRKKSFHLDISLTSILITSVFFLGINRLPNPMKYGIGILRYTEYTS